MTTTSLLSAGTLLLLEHPDQLLRLRNDPSLISSAVEEMLRLISPVTVAQCRAREDVDIEGYHFPTGVTRFAFLAAAIRDPDMFPDPDTFDIARAPNRNLAFGAGPHFCLGAPLARLHGEIAIPTLIRELPNLRLAGELIWRGAFPLRELEHLPVAWDIG